MLASPPAPFVSRALRRPPAAFVLGALCATVAFESKAVESAPTAIVAALSPRPVTPIARPASGPLASPTTARLGALVPASVSRARPTRTDVPAGVTPDVPRASPALTAATRNARADALHTEALAVTVDSSGRATAWRRAASLHLRAAALRSDDAARAFRCRELAATSLYNAGDLVAARATMELAASQALVHGDVAHAADADMKAALIAREQHDLAGESRLGRRVAALSVSPRLTRSESEALQARLVLSATVADTTSAPR